jgi:hypothetical protein
VVVAKGENPYCRRYLLIEASDEECLAAIRRRNEEKPDGVYWDHVSDDMFHAVNPYITPPSPDEGFNVRAHVRP